MAARPPGLSPSRVRASTRRLARETRERERGPPGGGPPLLLGGEEGEGPPREKWFRGARVKEGCGGPTITILGPLPRVH